MPNDVLLVHIGIVWVVATAACLLGVGIGRWLERRGEPAARADLLYELGMWRELGRARSFLEWGPASDALRSLGVLPPDSNLSFLPSLPPTPRFFGARKGEVPKS